MIHIPFLPSLVSSKSPFADELPKVRGKIRYNIPLAKYTWFGVGGPAEIFFEPADIEDLALMVKNKKNRPLTILGGGSNLLVRDGGVLGIVVKLTKPFSSITHENDTITVGAGVRNFELCKYAMEHNIGGLEFLNGIPGTVGGALKMNAGSFGSDTQSIFQSATIMDGMGNLNNIGLDDIHYGYRSSTIPNDWIFLKAVFKGYPSNAATIKNKMAEMKEKREKSQPIGVKTGGSTFKNLSSINMPAWKLIDKAGCRGMRVGGAVVSDKHCNFIINDNHATAADIELLGQKIVKQVLEICGVQLEWEIKIIGIEKRLKTSLLKGLKRKK